MMDPKEYIVSKIDGEYAVLQNVDGSGEIFIALALLPQGTDLGSRLHYEMFSYTVLD